MSSYSMHQAPVTIVYGGLATTYKGSAFEGETDALVHQVYMDSRGFCSFSFAAT